MDPLSMTASIIAIATLADIVVTRFGNYYKAVKNCREDVRKLKDEMTILASLLDRLARLAKECEQEEQDQSAQDLLNRAEPEGIINYVSACQATMNEIGLELLKFEEKAKLASAAEDGTSTSKKRSVFQRLSLAELKWPFSKPKTLELIASLERLKSTCIMALEVDELCTIREILNATKVSNEILAQIKSDTRVLVEDHMDAKTKEMLRWYGPVNPASKRQTFRKEYQKGTGLWIFETPEFVSWTKTANSGLWIYAIPGAGKTILASLVIETLSSRRQHGLAYFYCRYDDASSQKPTSILGSLVSQLCRQNTSARNDAMQLYKTHNTTSGLPSKPTEKELEELLKCMSLHFEQVDIVIDGLDEVGAITSINRLELVDILSTLHQGQCNIRVMIFSRNEADIREQLTSFASVSIAARSSDLRLYVAAKMHVIRVKGTHLMEETMNALIDGAEGMFFWTVCQIDYLKTLPTAAKIRQALKNLPPGLPATYCRILERIDINYSEDTQGFIQRALNWLIWGEKITMDELAHAICMDDTIEKLDPEDIPPREIILEWLGCLVRVADHDCLELAHFSIKEFLLRPKDGSISGAAQKYLMPETEKYGPALACVAYLSLSQMDKMSFNMSDDQAMTDFHHSFPFYHHAATRLRKYIRDYDTKVEPPQTRRLFTSTDPRNLYFWVQYENYKFCSGIPTHAHDNYWEDRNRFYCTPIRDWTASELHGDASHKITALHVACELRLVQTVSRLLSEGLSPNIQFPGRPASIHLADIALNGYGVMMWYDEDEAEYNDHHSPSNSIKFRILQALISAHADLNLTARFQGPSNTDVGYYSPLYIALWTVDIPVCELLIDNGALLLCDTEALFRMSSIYSNECHYNLRKQFISVLDRLLESDRYEKPFRATLQEIKLSAVCLQDDDISSVTGRSLDGHSTDIVKDQVNEAFLRAVQSGKVEEARYYSDKGADLNVLDAHGQSALAIAIRNKDNKMVYALNHKDSWSFILPTGHTPQTIALTELSFSEYTQVCMSTNAWERMSDNELEVVFEHACRYISLDTLSFILAKADKAGRLEILRTLLRDFPALVNSSQPSVLGILHSNGLLEIKGLQLLFSSICKKDCMDRIEAFLMCRPDFNPPSCYSLAVESVEGILGCGTTKDGCCICWAASEASPSVLTAISERMVRFNRGNIQGHLGLAVQRGDCRILKILLECGDDPKRLYLGKGIVQLAAHDNVTDDELSETPNNAAKVIKILQSAGGVISASYRGSNTIHYAMIHGSLSAVEYLASQGVDLHAANSMGERPLHWAAYYGFTAGVHYIIQNHFNLEIVNEAADNIGTPLYCAASCGRTAIVKDLLAVGASVDIVALPGNRLGPALYAACAEGHIDTVNMLLSHGSDQHIKGPRYHSAVDVANAFDRKKVLEVLENYGKSGAAISSTEAQLHKRLETMSLS